MPLFAISLSTFDQYLEQPEVLITPILVFVMVVMFSSIFVWGLLQLWLNRRQELYRKSRRYVLLAIDIPRESEQSPKAVEHVFSTISSAWGGPNFIEKWFDGEVAPVFSFEIVSIGGYIQYYVRLQTKFRDMVEAAIYAQYPDAEIIETDDYVNDVPDKFPDENVNGWGIEQTLKKPNYFPIKTYEEFEHKMSQELKDPLAMMLEQYAKLRPKEQLWTQILVTPLGPVGDSWAKEGVAYIYKELGKKAPGKPPGFMKELRQGFTWIPQEIAAQVGGMAFGAPPAAKEENPWEFLRSTPVDKIQYELIAKKVNKPGCHVKIRHVYVAPHDEWYKTPRDKMLKGVFNQYTILGANKFGRSGLVTPKTDYFWQRWSANTRRGKVVRAYKRRDVEIGPTPFVLNIEELATLWHFPTSLQKPPFIAQTIAKRAEPPAQLPFSETDGEEIFMTEETQTSTPKPLPIEFIEPSVVRSAPEAPLAPREPEPTSEPAEPVAPAPLEPDVAIAVPKAPLVAQKAPGKKPQHRRVPRRASESTSAPEAEGDDIPDAIRLLIDPSVEE